MKDYSYAEIGMLVGAAIGGTIAFALFSVTGSVWSYLVAALGIYTGIYAGRVLDRKERQGENADVSVSLQQIFRRNVKR